MTDPQVIVNLGTGGSDLNGQNGSTSSADSNDAKFLDWPGDNAGNYVYLPGVGGNELTVPDEAALDITGDIDIRVQVALEDWTPTGDTNLAQKYTNAGQRSWLFYLSGGGNTGKLGIIISPDGTSTSLVRSTVANTIADGSVKWVRVTVDVDNGASGWDAAFYVSDDGVTWDQLGTTVTTGTATSIHAGTDDVRIFKPGAVGGKVYRAQVLDGIDGTTVLDVDTSVITSGSATSFTALTGQTVTINRSTSGRKSVAVVSPVHLFGTDDYWEVADNALLDFGASDSFTVLAVVRQWSSVSSGARMVSKAGNTAADGGYRLWLNSAPSPTLTVADGTNEFSRATTAVSLGDVSVVAGVLDRATDTTTTYLDGSPSATTDVASLGDTSNALPFRIGSQSNAVARVGEYEMIGVSVFRRVLTAAEISNLTTYYQNRLT